MLSERCVAPLQSSCLTLCLRRGVPGRTMKIQIFLYGSDAYRAYATENFQGLGLPSILGRIADWTNSSSFPVQFLWCASFLRRKG